jgi:hypothetical protein
LCFLSHLFTCNIFRENENNSSVAADGKEKEIVLEMTRDNIKSSAADGETHSIKEPADVFESRDDLTIVNHEMEQN